MYINSDTINTIDTQNLKDFIPDNKFVLMLAQKDKIDYVYNTAALEGNAMTYPEVQTLLEGITVGGHKLSDEQQVLNQNRSVNLLFDLIKNFEFELNKHTFTLLHSKVAQEEALLWGEFRKSGVNIGGTDYKPPLARELDLIFETTLNEIFKIEHAIVRAITFLLFGARTQFFYDGNKRTSRLMMNGELLKYGYPILNIKARDKLWFNTLMIAFYNSGDYTHTLRKLIEYYIKENSHLISGK